MAGRRSNHGWNSGVVAVAVVVAVVSLALLRDGATDSGAADLAPAHRYESGTELIVKLRDTAPAATPSGLLADLGVDGDGLAVHRVFTTPVARLARERDRIRRSSRRSLADLTKYFRVSAPNAAATDAALAQLSAAALVATVYRKSLPVPPPATPNFEGLQGYRLAAPDGVGASVVGSVPGASGAAVKVIDVEYGWNQQHEDLSKARNALIPNGTPIDPFPTNDHGTAVLGELVADANGFGVTGIVPDASLGLVNVYNSERGYDLANSIDLAHHELDAGDVMVIEQQAGGPACSDCYLPVEWDQAAYDAIVSAAADGVLVVEAAGNGGQDLDEERYGSPFPGGRASSGAFLVGASDGCNHPRSRLGLSNYGARLDFQGWGSCVVTTGLGTQYADGPNALYWAGFSGTSSATPIVAGAFAGFSSAYRTHFGVPPTPELVRSVFLATGTSQQLGPDTLSGRIGPQPDLAAALGVGLGRPANDNFANAQSLGGTGGTVAGTTLGATKEPGEPSHVGNSGGASVWYQWTAPASGTLTVDTFTSGFDTLLEAYRGSTLSSLVPIVANDTDSGGLQSRVGPFTVTAGTKYLIAVDGAAGTAGALSLTWRYVATAPALAALPGRLAP